MVLEALSYAYPGTFVTLTYNPRSIPVDGSVVPDHLETFRRALRYRIGPFRYFFVGEYGGRTFRPHYHALVFGHQLSARQLAELWPYVDLADVKKGIGIRCGSITAMSAAYCAGYVTKKLTNNRDERARSILAGRHPEFTRRSRKPGLGVPGLGAIKQWLWSEEGALYVARHGDVPNSIRFEGRVLPLGRYMVEHLRKEVDVEAPNSRRDIAGAIRAYAMVGEEAREARELKRIGTINKALAYERLNLSKEKL